MALAISLLFDAETDRAVRHIWQVLADSGICRTMLDMDYAPHLSLVVTDDESLEGPLSDALTAWTEGALSIDLRPARSFPDTSIGWLAGDGGDSLMRLHALIAATVPLESIRPHYRPGQWTPHVTLQMTGDVKAGVAMARELWPPACPPQAVGIELARFMPVEPLGRVDLA